MTQRELDLGYCEEAHTYCSVAEERYQQGKSDVLKDIAKIIDDYACERDVKANVSLGQMISQYIYKQTKEQNNA